MNVPITLRLAKDENGCWVVTQKELSLTTKGYSLDSCLDEIEDLVKEHFRGIEEVCLKPFSMRAEIESDTNTGRTQDLSLIHI